MMVTLTFDLQEKGGSAIDFGITYRKGEAIPIDDVPHALRLMGYMFHILSVNMEIVSQ